MPYVKNVESYRQLSFSADTPTGEFYQFMTVATLSRTEDGTSLVQQRCQTVGVLYSANGQYYLRNIDRHDSNERCEISVSFEFMSLPPPPTVVPYTAQLFGSLGFVDSKPILYASVLMQLPHDVARQIYKLMKSICSTHLATSTIPDHSL